jgi:PAS domain S-box-containing protein
MTSTPRIGAERLTELLDSLSEGFQIIGHDFRYLYVNEAVCRHGRRPSDELLGRTMMDAYPGIEHTEMFARLTTCIQEGRPTSMENEFTYPDGRKGWFEIRMEAIPEGALILSADITARKSLEAQLLHSQKMDAVGRLAGGVAHDFNNLLSVIQLCAHMLGESLGEADPRSGDVDEISRAATRATKLTRQLLAFSRQQVLEPRVLDLNETVRGAQTMLARLIGEDIQSTWRLGDGLRRVFADEGQLEQVLMNLVLNARDAMPGGGRLVVETGNAELDQDYADRHAGVVPGRYVMLAVSDTGIGMSPETQARIFDPFFTTKPTGRGTGLGLATAYGIVRQCGGDIWVYSELGRGTTFKVYLPESTSLQIEETRPALRPEDLRGSESILLVEDDEQVRTAASALLRRCGYRVLEAPAAREALRLAEATDAIDLLLSDVVMPELSGVELAEQVSLRYPDLKILCCSGYTEEVVVNHGLLPTGIPFLQKPFTGESLARRVRQVLDASTSR